MRRVALQRLWSIDVREKAFFRSKILCGCIGESGRTFQRSLENLWCLVHKDLITYFSDVTLFNQQTCLLEGINSNFSISGHRGPVFRENV